MTTISSYFSKPNPATSKKPIEEKSEKDSNKSSREEETTIPWVEKYRPKTVDDVICQEEVVAVLKRCIQGADLPNLLLYGPPGTGKTSAAIALCHQLFRTPQMYKDRVLELNASDERGIDVVRNRIKEFSRLSISASRKCKDALVPLKIVILDEADAMTGAAQSALRRTMENETQTTRFFLICNYVTRIIEPLTSRCAKFRFKPLSEGAQNERLLTIAKAEGVTMVPGSADQLVSISGGDLRKSITLLQSMACSGRPISIEDVKEMSGQVPEEEMDPLVEAAKSLDQTKVIHSVKQFIKQGYSVTQLLSQLTDAILREGGTLTPIQKALLLEKMAESEKRLLEGADEYLQLLDLILAFQGHLMEL